MRQADDGRIGQRSTFKVEAAVLGEEIPREAIFAHRKLVTIRQRNCVMVAIEQRVHLFYEMTTVLPTILRFARSRKACGSSAKG